MRSAGLEGIEKNDPEALVSVFTASPIGGDCNSQGGTQPPTQALVRRHLTCFPKKSVMMSL